jgi:hypothetical protein
MNDRQKEYFHKLYQPLVGGKIVGFRIDEDSFGMSPFPVFILATVAVSCSLKNTTPF